MNRYYEKDVTNGVVTTYYYHGNRLVALRKGTTIEYVHQDHLGGTIATTNTSGAIAATQEYYAFGEVRSSTGTLNTDRKFTGQRLDEETGLYFYNARYYDASIGRFTRADSIVQTPGDPQSLNRFSYVVNNPLRYTDPTGRCWGRFSNAPGCGVLRDAGRAVGSLATDVGDIIVDSGNRTIQGYVEIGQAVVAAPVEGAKLAIGIEEIITVTVKVSGQEVTYSNVVAAETGLDLISNGITLIGGVDTPAVAIGGPLGVWSRDPLPRTLQLHEGQHIMEQDEVGMLKWHIDYQTEYWADVLKYGDREQAYRYNSAENRARLAAGERTFWPSGDDAD